MPAIHAIAALLLGTTLLAAPQGELPSDFGRSFAAATPEQVGIASDGLAAMTEWLREQPLPVFSLLVSRRGKLVYEFYTSGLDRDAAHYVMSVTKSVVSALVGIAIDEKVLPGADAKVAALLPRRLFASDEARARFAELMLREVLGMAALDAPLPPRDTSPAAVQRQAAFWAAPNRLAFALGQPLLPPKPVPFQYNDVTPTLAVGLLQYRTGTTALEFAQQHLFAPLGFRNAEWMHQDAAGIDLGGYGLRLRPIDMQKFGVLYLQRGAWEGRQLLPRSWVELSFTPWNRSQPQLASADYGFGWWTRRDAKWLRHEANGWRGQRIAVLPEPELVVTMTACLDEGSEEAVFQRIVDEFLPAALRRRSALPPAPAAQRRLQELLQAANGWQRLPADIESRMVPSATAKETHRPFGDAEPAPRR